jgi:hypothetical protein
MRLTLLGAALVFTTCASSPSPRPVALDPANPAAPEGRPLSIALIPAGAPLEASRKEAPLPSPDGGAGHDGHGATPP